MPHRVRSYLRDHLPRRVSLALAVVLVAGFASAPAHAAEKGVVPEITWGGINSSTQDRIATHIGDLGAKWVRLHVSWAEGEPNKGSFSSSALSRFDRGISLSRQAGAKVIVMVHQSPSWARDSSNVNAPPRNVADYAAFVSFLANRWRGQVEAYEIWNEPNVGGYYVAPQQYGAMVKTAGAGIRVVDPTAKILTGGLYTNDYGYLEAVFASTPDVGAYFDVIGAHPYIWNINPGAYWRGGDGRIASTTFAGYRELRNTVRNRGGGDKPVWITEMGWSTTAAGAGWGVSAEAQAALLTEAYRCLEQDPFVQVATYYNLRNNWFQNDVEDWDAQLGLLRTDWTKKPGYHAFQGYNPGAGGCTYHDLAGAAAAPGTSPAPAPAPATASGTATTTATKAPARRTAARRLSLVLKVRRARTGRRAKIAARGGLVRVSGRIPTLKAGRVAVTFERRVGRRYRVVRRTIAKINSRGAFSRVVRVGRSGRWRVRGVVAKSRTRPALVSRHVYVTL